MTTARPVQLVIGASLVVAALAGRMHLFVRPWFVPVVAATGLLLLVALRTDRPPRVPAATAALLLLPVLAGATMTPELAGQARPWTAADGTAITARLGDGDNQLLRGDGGTVTILQVVLADRELGAAALDGRQVALEALVTDASSLTRQVMVCCAADARPVSVATRGSLPPVGTWVRASGVLTADGHELVLVVETVTPIDTPRNPLL